MEDRGIVELYWRRSEEAVSETQRKYGNYLLKIAENVLHDKEDSEESVNDTYLRAWETMPEQRPAVLSTYLGKITRGLSIDIFRRKHSKKRGESEYALSLAELEEAVPGGSEPEAALELSILVDAINAYLRTLSDEARNIFVCRYYFMDSIKEIAGYSGAGEAKIKSILHRARKGLKEHLEQEGWQ